MAEKRLSFLEKQKAESGLSESLTETLTGDCPQDATAEKILSQQTGQLFFYLLFFLSEC